MMKNKQMFRVGMACLVACVSLVLASCDLNDDSNVQPVPVSYVSLYNASPDAPSLDILVDSRQINSYPFEYADRTGYLAFYTGNRKLQFSPDGASNVAVDTTVTLVADRVYSIFVADVYQKATVLVLADSSAAAPAAGKALLRVVNLSPDASPVTLREKDAADTIAGNVGFKQATAFLEVDAKAHNFEITSATAGEAALTLPNVALREGAFYTVVVRGYRTPPAGNKNVISAEVIGD